VGSDQSPIYLSWVALLRLVPGKRGPLAVRCHPDDRGRPLAVSAPSGILLNIPSGTHRPRQSPLLTASEAPGAAGRPPCPPRRPPQPSPPPSAPRSWPRWSRPVGASAGRPAPPRSWASSPPPSSPASRNSASSAPAEQRRPHPNYRSRSEISGGFCQSLVRWSPAASRATPRVDRANAASRPRPSALDPVLQPL
jgi:hypothetical protein